MVRPWTASSGSNLHHHWPATRSRPTGGNEAIDQREPRSITECGASHTHFERALDRAGAPLPLHPSRPPNTRAANIIAIPA